VLAAAVVWKASAETGAATARAPPEPHAAQMATALALRQRAFALGSLQKTVAKKLSQLALWSSQPPHLATKSHV
jgi:hypothetical protein